MDDVRKIKGLKSQLKFIADDADSLKNDIDNKTIEYNKKLQQIKNINSEIRKIDNNKKLKVSEHAIIRYFERVKGFDISKIEDEILNDTVLDMVEKLGGSGRYPNNGYQVVLKNLTVTTIITK